MPASPPDRPRDAAEDFETEARRVAGLLYPGDDGGGATIINDQERDGVFITEDAVIAIEATTSSAKEKAEKDGRKLKALTDQLARKYPYKAVKGFFITRGDPTAHQQDAIRKIGAPVAAISFAKFRARLIDSRAYLEARNDHAFGSARDPETDDVQIRDKYVSLDFVEIVNPARRHSVIDVIDAVAGGHRVVLVGDYGAGKSMTMREVYLEFRKRNFRSDDSRFCLHLNLNDHQGQTEPSESLIRHASLIGFPHPHQLVRAWRSGEAHLILDGFDEVFIPGWATGGRPLSEVRHKSVELVRRFVRDTPSTSGLVLAGRAHFFDNNQELISALGISATTLVLSATDFTEEQVGEYLRQRAWTAALPDWLPRRPLIIGYLAGRRLFTEVEDLAFSDVGGGWDHLLSVISRREARADVGVDEIAVRQVVERLATRARRTSSGIGPLQFEDLVTVFRDLRGYLPDEGAYSVLQRLPGLRVHDTQKNSRVFVDDDFVDAARAGDVYRWIEDPRPETLSETFLEWTNLMRDVGLSVLRHRLAVSRIPVVAVQTALVQAQKIARATGLHAELMRIVLELGSSPARPVALADIHLPSLRLAVGADGSSISLTGCLIELLDLSEGDWSGALSSALL